MTTVLPSLSSASACCCRWGGGGGRDDCDDDRSSFNDCRVHLFFSRWDGNNDDKTRLQGGRGGRREIARNVAVSGGAQLLWRRFDNNGPPRLLFGIGVEEEGATIAAMIVRPPTIAGSISLFSPGTATMMTRRGCVSLLFMRYHI